ncbi:hypothetical protein ALC60_09858 [Trachymyrmex zeteki]|uniref:Uncharacterized protein n=1 Tax=Mycetomoellerius zeteki TaxID=64791 RepID=A0A151WTE7_9HYME|nr:hypothetical protein ALC60_09858 [Trachymyrmex zeteki]
MGNKNRISKLSVKVTNTTVGNKDATFHTIASGKINSSMKKHDGNNDTPKSSSESHNTTKSIVAKQSSSSTYSSVRPVSTCISNTVHENTIKNPRDYTAPKKFPNETDSNIKNYPIQSDYKQSMSVNSPDYKNTSIAGSITANLPLRFATQQSSTATPVIHREIYTPSSTYSPQSGSCQRNDNSAFAVARKALEQQQSSMPKMAPINFPPLRAPQSIVNVRHPLLTDARIKHGNETIGGGISGGGVSVGSVGVGGVGVSSGKSKLNIIGSLQGGGIKDLSDHTGRSQTTFHGYGTSPIAPGIPSVQNLSSAVTANIPPYPRPEPFPQPTVANVLFPDTAAQFPQSPPFNTTPQIGQLNQYQTYDPGSYPTTPVNVNPVIPQFPAESSIPYPQYENPPQFVQPSHYPTADITNSQYQYQAAAAAAASVGQIQDSSIFIQSLQSTIAVTDQYATPNYARTVRTELITRLRRPPRFNK